MPLVVVTYDPRTTPDQLQRIADVLPPAVSVAVACPEEPYDGALSAGDVDVRFRPRGPYDSGGLEVVVEVRSKWFESRAATREERCEQLCAAVIDAAGTSSVGVYLSLPVATWAQGE